jgi:hypothetical protein
MSESKNFKVCTLSSKQMNALRKQIQKERHIRDLPNFDVTKLTNSELDELEEKLTRQRHGTQIDFSNHNYPNLVEKVLEKLAEIIQLGSEKKMGFLTLKLRHTSMKEEDFNQICQHILANKYLRENLIYLDLAQNQALGVTCLPLLRKLISECLNLELLDFSGCSYSISREDFLEIFHDLQYELRSRLKIFWFDPWTEF